MPEGPEIEALSIVLNKLGYHTKRYGKHLFVEELLEDWHFGLVGKVIITANKISKHSNSMSGLVRKCESYNDMVTFHEFKQDWLRSSKEGLETIVNGWRNRTKVLGNLMLDQEEIAGIGVAWGSEICNLANLDPALKANTQDLDSLVDAMITIRTNIMTEYTSFIKNVPDNRAFVEEWFHNLYGIRTMQVYKIGKKIPVSSRDWWVQK